MRVISWAAAWLHFFFLLSASALDAAPQFSRRLVRRAPPTEPLLATDAAAAQQLEQQLGTTAGTTRSTWHNSSGHSSGPIHRPLELGDHVGSLRAPPAEPLLATDAAADRSGDDQALPEDTAAQSNASLHTSRMAFTELPTNQSGFITVVSTAHQHGPRIQGQIRYLTMLTEEPYNKLVHEVMFVWNGKTNKVPKVPKTKALKIVTTGTNSLNNRWLEPMKLVNTEAVLMLDDDIQITYDGLRCLYTWWKAYPQRLVGVFGRNIKVDSAPHRSLHFEYSTVDIGMTSGSFNFLLPRVLMFSRTLLGYYDLLPRSILDYIDRQAAHCDDVAFNAIVAKKTRKAPLRVVLPEGSIIDCDNSQLLSMVKAVKNVGISRQSTRRSCRQCERTECSNVILAALGNAEVQRDELLISSNRAGSCLDLNTREVGAGATETNVQHWVNSFGSLGDAVQLCFPWQHINKTEITRSLDEARQRMKLDYNLTSLSKLLARPKADDDAEAFVDPGPNSEADET